MLHTYVQKSDVMDTVENFLGTKQDLKNRGKNTKIPFFYVYCIWISKFILAVVDPSKEFSINFFIRCIPQIYVSEYSSLNTPIDL